MLYIRDDDSEEIWSPTALPIRDDQRPMLLVMDRAIAGSIMVRMVSWSNCCSLCRLKTRSRSLELTLQNASGRSRRLSVTAYAEWVLGSSRGDSAPYIITEIDAETGALFARNLLGGEFRGRIAFADLAGKQTSWTG